MNKLESEVIDDIISPYKRAIPKILEYTLRENSVVNIYKFMGYKGFSDFIIHLDDYITIIAVELFVNALDEHGVEIYDTPDYREMMVRFFENSGIKFDDEMYDVVNDSLAELTNIMIVVHGNETSEAFKLISFLRAASHYTNITYVISKMYSIISKNYASIISDATSVDNISSDLSDIIEFAGISDSSLVYNENVLEFISMDIMMNGMYHCTFLEYIETGNRNIYKILLGGDDDV